MSSSRFAFAGFAFLAMLSSAPTLAASFATQLDTTCHYSYGDTLTVIWKPLATLPELVRPGDTLTVWAKAPSTPTNWTAALQFAALHVSLTPAGGSFQSSLGWW